MQRQLDKDSEEIYPTEFMFADGQELKIHIEAPECQHAMESSNKVVMTACILAVSHITFFGSISILDKYHAFSIKLMCTQMLMEPGFIHTIILYSLDITPPSFLSPPLTICMKLLVRYI